MACLTRPEGALLAVLTHVGLLLTTTGVRRQFLASVLAGVPVLLTLLLLTGWRLWFYGEPLPNTFYAKTGGQAWGRGAEYLWSNIRVRPLLWFLIAIRPLLGGRL